MVAILGDSGKPRAINTRFQEVLPNHPLHRALRSRRVAVFMSLPLTMILMVLPKWAVA